MEDEDEDEDEDMVEIEVPVWSSLTLKPFGIAISTFLLELLFDNKSTDCFISIFVEAVLSSFSISFTVKFIP